MAASLIHRPELFLMDEPFEGVDAVGARLMKDILLDQVRHGATIFLTSHVLEVVERLCDYAAIINEGRIVAEGRMQDLRGGSETLEDVFVRIVSGERGREYDKLEWLDLKWTRCDRRVFSHRRAGVCPNHADPNQCRRQRSPAPPPPRHHAVPREARADVSALSEMDSRRTWPHRADRRPRRSPHHRQRQNHPVASRRCQHLRVPHRCPAGVSTLDVALDFISPPETAGFSSGASTTSHLAVLSWNQLAAVPERHSGRPACNIRPR